MGRYYSDLILSESSLQSYWKLNEASGSVADSKGSLTGTASGSFTYSQSGYGVLGNSILSDGASPTRFAFGDNLNFSGTSAYTMEAWLKMLDDSTGRFISKYDESNGNGYHLAVASSKLYSQRFGSSTNTELTGATTLSNGSWYHVAVTYSGSKLNLYLNGATDATEASSTQSIVTVTAKPFTLFATADTLFTTATYYLKCNLQHVAVYNTALSASTLLSHYNAGLAEIVRRQTVARQAVTRAATR